ncbi:FAD-binding oxidoreductase [Streptomyces sp. NBC_00335]|uniref:FAD-binding oxidoreductase n=1 Tax=unclassified Streptomyces TaxID=2593676 RepID=UPI00224E6F21|nr:MULTISPECIES: FAD-binding oxidoreductase [unclassified Streptomyces]MCX5402768.1 FAD-binding oxidoreductase [Streptomyces sp. NBC_00086]
MSLHRRQVLAGAATGVLASIGAAAPTTARTTARTTPRTTTRRADPDYGALARALDGRVVTAGDGDYDEARQLFQPRYDTVRPGAVAYPAHPGDVAACLDFARRSAVPVVPRGGGHGYAGWSTREAGLVIDTSAMADVAAESGTGVRVGAGARLGEVNSVLAARGLAVPTGLCPSVGIAGLTLGGGLGLSSRSWGATSDRLTGVSLVTPDGTLREVAADREPDLFWALRGGGGGNFGVVTGFRFRTHPVSDCAFAELRWSAADSPAVLRGWQRWLEALPDPFWSQVEFTVDGGPVGAPALRVLCLDGGRAELERQLTRLSDLVGAPPRDSWSVVRGYADTVRAMAGCLDRSPAECRLPGTLPGHDPRGRLGRASYAARSDFWAPDGLTEAAASAVLAALRRYAGSVPRGGFGVVQFDGVCGGALNRIPARATAFAHRTAGFLAQYLIYWPGPATAADIGRHQGWLDGLWQDLRPWAGGAAYQNYADPRLTGWREAYYGPNLARLEEVRRRYDPDRLLRFPQAV